IQWIALVGLSGKPRSTSLSIFAGRLGNQMERRRSSKGRTTPLEGLVNDGSDTVSTVGGASGSGACGATMVGWSLPSASGVGGLGGAAGLLAMLKMISPSTSTTAAVPPPIANQMAKGTLS